MAIDKAVDSAVLESNLTAVADAIRAKTGGSDPLAFPSGMVDAIAGITSGGGGGGVSNPFLSVEELTVAGSYTNMGSIRTYLDEIVATEVGVRHKYIAFIAKEKPTAQTVNSAFVACSYFWNEDSAKTTVGPIRWRNGAYQNSSWGNDYDGILKPGDVLYKITVSPKGV